jgi:hypothetical protein
MEHKYIDGKSGYNSCFLVSRLLHVAYPTPHEPHALKLVPRHCLPRRCNHIPLGFETALKFHYLHQGRSLLCANELLYVSGDVTFPGLVFINVEVRIDPSDCGRRVLAR